MKNIFFIVIALSIIVGISRADEPPWLADTISVRSTLSANESNAIVVIKSDDGCKDGEELQTLCTGATINSEDSFPKSINLSKEYGNIKNSYNTQIGTDTYSNTKPTTNMFRKSGSTCFTECRKKEIPESNKSNILASSTKPLKTSTKTPVTNAELEKNNITKELSNVKDQESKEMSSTDVNKILMYDFINKYDYNKKLYDYKTNLMTYNMSVLWQQYISNILILALVFFLVLGGFYMSYKQFQDSTNEDETKIKIGTSGIHIKSNFIGLIILIVSLSFFYLYVVNVYSISTVGGISKNDIKQADATELIVQPASSSNKTN